MNKLLEVDISKGKFTAGGKTYLIEGKLSVARKMMADKFMVEIGSGITVGEHFSNLKKLYEMLNKQQFADCAVAVHNQMQGLKNWSEHRDPVLNLCALYINEENEDRRTITDEQIKVKIADWMEAGLPYDFFLIMATALLKQQIVNWSELFPPSSSGRENQEEIKPAI